MVASTTARCFVTHAGEPHYNMAFDECLFLEAVHNPELVALRLYTWEPGGITIGLNQRAELALDWQRVGGTAVIRRATGGRALFHDPSELTYAIVLGASAVTRSAAAGGNSQLSSRLADGLVRFLARIGIGAEFVRRSGPVDRGPVSVNTAPCFASTARYELVAGGEKIIASAQRRISEAVLQHGSIKTNGVVQHDALPLVAMSSRTSTAIQSIENEQLNIAAVHFFGAMAETLGVDWEVCKTVDTERLTQLTAQIMSAPLGRREFH